MSKIAALKSVGASALAVAVLFTAFAVLSVNAAEDPATTGDESINQSFFLGHAFGGPMRHAAEELGITKEEFEAAKGDPALREEIRAKMEEMRQSHLQERADELGITIDELIAQREIERQEHLAARADELGISVDELLAQRPERGRGFGCPMDGARPFDQEAE